jgi:Carbohydrate-binding module 48 (Isoamylase N-terminal domain)
MIDPELDPNLEWIAREARRTIVADPAAKDRIMAAIRAEPLPMRPSRVSRVWRSRWLLEPRSFNLSPVASLAAAAGLVGVGLLVGILGSNRGGSPTDGPTVRVVDNPQPPVSSDSVQTHMFVLVAPHASNVALVGDFNNWDASATPMTRTPTGGTWRVALPLHPGRYAYAFVVNTTGGTQHVADPSAPLAPEDGLGAPNSVVLVGGST